MEFELEVFRAGDYGTKGKYTEADVATIAANYDPSYHEAPVVLDHVTEGPAFGWVKSLRAEGTRLFATLHRLSTELVDAIKDGRFIKRSVGIYRNFEGTGKKHLRELSFLGGNIPVVKGLAPVNLSEMDSRGGEFDALDVDVENDSIEFVDEATLRERWPDLVKAIEQNAVRQDRSNHGQKARRAMDEKEELQKQLSEEKSKREAAEKKAADVETKFEEDRKKAEATATVQQKLDEALAGDSAKNLPETVKTRIREAFADYVDLEKLDEKISKVIKCETEKLAATLKELNVRAPVQGMGEAAAAAKANAVEAIKKSRYEKIKKAQIAAGMSEEDAETYAQVAAGL